MSTTYIADLVPLDDSDRIAAHNYVPGTGFVAPQGGVASTDARGVTSAPQAVTLTSGALSLGALITAAGATTTQTLGDQTNINCRGIEVVLDMTVNAGGAGSVTLEIDNKDAASGKYYPILTGAAVTTVSTNVYRVFPGAPVTANVSANDCLAPAWRIKVVANNANPTSYTVGAFLIV